MDDTKTEAAKNESVPEPQANMDPDARIFPTIVSVSMAWLITLTGGWIGTTLAGGVFGLLAGLLIGLSEGWVLWVPSGGIVGLLWAGFVGLHVFPTLASINWIVGGSASPTHLAAVSGALTGALCGLLLFPITAPLGGVGGYLVVKRFLRTSLGQMIDAKGERIQSLPPESLGKQQLSLASLFSRMTAVAVLLSVWLTLFRLYFPS